MKQQKVFKVTTGTMNKRADGRSIECTYFDDYTVLARTAEEAIIAAKRKMRKEEYVLEIELVAILD